MVLVLRVKVQSMRARWKIRSRGPGFLHPSRHPGGCSWATTPFELALKTLRHHPLLWGTKVENINLTPLRQKSGTWLRHVDLFTLERISLKVIPRTLPSMQYSSTSTVQVRDKNFQHPICFREGASLSLLWFDTFHLSFINLTLLLTSFSQNSFPFLLMPTQYNWFSQPPLNQSLSSPFSPETKVKWGSYPPSLSSKYSSTSSPSWDKEAGKEVSVALRSSDHFTS